MFDLARTQVHALVAAPFLLDHPNITDMFPADAITRAKLMLQVRCVAATFPHCMALPPRFIAQMACMHYWVVVWALPCHLKGRILCPQNMPGGIGAYTDSRGAPGIRQEIANYLTQRDGFAADPEVCRAL